MGTMLVVVLEVLDDDGLEVTSAEDQQAVEALPAQCPHDPLADGVRSRRADGRADHLDCLGGYAADHGISQLSITEIPQLTARVGCC